MTKLAVRATIILRNLNVERKEKKKKKKKTKQNKTKKRKKKRERKRLERMCRTVSKRFKPLCGKRKYVHVETFSKCARTGFSFIRGIIRTIFGFVYKRRLGRLVIVAMRVSQQTETHVSHGICILISHFLSPLLSFGIDVRSECVSQF